MILHVGDRKLDLGDLARLYRRRPPVRDQLPGSEGESEELGQDAYDAREGVYFSARPLGGGRWGIRTLTYRGGALETENLNTTPWPTEEVALQQAERAARGEAEREGLPFRGRSRDERAIEQGDVVAAQRGLNMVGMSLLDLKDLVREHEGKNVFASKVIVVAAKQMIAAKSRMGARDDLLDEMVKRAMVEVKYALSRGMNFEEAIAYAKERSTAGPKVWEIIRQSRGRDAAMGSLGGYEYTRVDTSTLEGLKKAERLQAATPISGRFNSKEEAEAHLGRRTGDELPSEMRERARKVYESALRRASDPAARAEAKEDYEATLREIELREAG